MKKLGSILVALLLGCVLATQVQAADINFTPSTTISGAGVMLYFEGYGTTFKRDKSYYNVSFIENTSSATTVMVNDCAGPYVYLGMNAGPVAGNKIVLQVLYDDGTTTGCGKVEFSGTQFVQSLSCDNQPPVWNEAPSLSCGSPNKVAFNVSASDALSDIAGYKVSIGSCVDKNVSVTNATKNHTGVIELPLASCGVTLTASSNLTATIKPYDSGGNVGAAQTVSGIKVMQSTLTMQSVNCGTVHGRSITLEPMLLGGNAASYMVSVNGAAATSYPGGSTIDVTGLETETTYSFSVSAVDGCGNESNAVSTSCTTIFEPYGGADYPEELIETSFDIQYTGSCATSIAGGTAFSQAGASGAYSHSIDEIDVIGSFTLPDEFEEAYSNGYFHQDATKKQYAIVSNPKVLNGTYTQKTDGKNRLVLALGSDPAGTQTNLFRFQRENVGPGTTTISFVLEDLVGDATCPQTNLNSFRGLTIVYYKNGAEVAVQHPNHPIGTAKTYSYNFSTAQGDDVMVDVRVRYMATCTAMAVSDLNVYGCLPKSIITRNGASIFCENQEVTLLATGVPNGTLQWQTSTDNANWQPISQNGMSIQVTVPLGNSYYRYRESASSTWSDTYTLLGQVCCTYLASQDEIWKEDFGTVTGRTSNSFVKNHTFKTSGKIDDCYYAVVSNSSQANQELDWPGGKKDHTGNTNGGFLVINVNNTIAPPVLIYEQEINPTQGFCESTYYNLSMFASNIAPGGLPSSFKFQVVDVVTREVLGEGETGDIADFGMANWLNYGVSFKPQGNPIKIQIYNTGYAGGGNDVVIDDIAVSVCNASVELLSNGKKVAEEVACGDNIPLEVKLNGNSNTFFGVSPPYYLWVKQTDGGAFEKVPAASGIGKDTYQAPTESGKEFTYKVIVAKDEATVLRAFSGTTDACDIYTETNVMTVTCIPCTTPTISLQASESVVCASSADPVTLTATVVSGVPASYVWSVKKQGDAVFTPLATHTTSNTTDTYTISTLPNGNATYQVKVVTPDGCQGTAETTVSVVTTHKPTVTTPDEKITCAIQAVTLTASVPDWTGVVSQQWYNNGVAIPGEIGRTLTTTNEGNYTITLTYASGCTETSDPLQMDKDDTPPTVSISVIEGETELTCNVTELTLLATATGNVDYFWSVEGSSSILSRTDKHTTSAPGKYTVLVTADNGCTDTDNITITQDITKPTASLSANRTTINCQDLDATLSATATGGVTPYQYAWNGGAYGNETTSTVTAGGNYTLKVKGYNGCESDVATLPITENKTTPTAVITSDVTPAVITCATGSITLTATPADGAEPYQYDWGEGYGDVSTHTVSATGSYTVNVKDANFCTGTSTAFVVQSDTLTSAVSLSSLVDKFTCSLSSIVITASVDAAFTSKVDYVEWYKDGNLQAGQTGLTYTATEAASYQAVVYYTNGCHRGSAAISLTNDSSMPTVTLSATATTLTCNQSTTTITATATALAGIVNYEWNTGLSGAAATTLTLTQGVDVLNNPYRVIVTDANGCSASAEIVIDEDVDKPAISITSDASEFVCSTASIKLQAVPQDPTAAYTYQWTDGPATDVYTITASGTYQVVATGSNGCQSDPVDVTINDAVNKLTVSIQSNVPDNKLTCYVDNIALTATPSDPVGDVSYEWVADVTFVASSSNLQTVVAAGRYTVKAKDENGCTASDFIDITDDYAEPTITITPSAAELTCAVTSLDLTASAAEDDGTFYYEWDPAVQVSTPVLSVTEPGDYTVRVIGANGCDATATHTVDADESVPTVTIQTENNQTLITCAVTSIALQAQATGGVVAQDYQYVWTDNNETEALRRVTAEGSYTVVVTDDNGCSGTATVTITENIAKPVSHFDRDMSTELTCKNPSITLTPIIDTENLAPFDYYWSDGSTSDSRVIDQPVENLSMYVVSQVNGCDSEPSTITITQAENNLEVSIEADNTTLTCNRESVTITAQVQGAVLPIASYTWTGGASSSSIMVTQAGPYWVEVTDDNGCTVKSNTLDITEWYTMPDASLEQVGLDSMLITPIGDEAMPWIYQLDNDTTFIDGLSFSSYAGQHELFITDQNGCKAVVPFVIELKLVEIKIPAFFTPNDDDLNDTWEIENIEYYPNALIQIYDRYHKLLVEYKGCDPGWDGMYNGHPMPSDDYWYYIRDIHIGRPKSGHFRLHRGKVYK